jgi:hypothetical protein
MLITDIQKCKGDQTPYLKKITTVMFDFVAKAKSEY